MSEYTLRGVIDPHVHLRDFGHAHKETFDSGTRAAAAGGVTTVLDMPNNYPPDRRPYTHYRMVRKRAQATGVIHVDVGMYAASQPDDNNVGSFESLQMLSCGLKSYIDITQGNDNNYEPRDFADIWRGWHAVANPTQPIVLHAEERVIQEALRLSAKVINHPTHVAHISTRKELETVITAKNKGLPVTCGVTPHHLFLSRDNQTSIGWRSRMKPDLGDSADQDFLWANIDAIDVFETDHAPHTREEKDRADSLNPEANTGTDKITSYGVPGLEAMLPLLWTAMRQGLLTEKQLLEKTSTNAARIFGLSLHPGNLVTIKDETYEFSASDVKSKCGWSPYIGQVMVGRVTQVRLRGKEIYCDGKLTDLSPQGQVLTPVRI